MLSLLDKNRCIKYRGQSEHLRVTPPLLNYFMPQTKQKQNKSRSRGMLINDPPLPKGWLWVRLADIADIVMGNSPPSSSYNTVGRGVPLINGPTEFDPGPFDNPKILQFTDAPSKFCEIGDLLICVRGSTTGRTNIASFRACIGRGVAAIRAPECQLYVNHYVASQTDQILSIGTGSTFPNITAAQLAAIPVPLPPEIEQALIVEAVEQSLANINDGIAALIRAGDDLIRLRAALLHKAVTGDLAHSSMGSADHRESGGELLRRILVERQRQARQTGKAGGKSQNKLPVKARRQHEQPLQGDNSFGTLPKNWTRATLGQLCDIQLGKAKNPSNRPKEHSTPYLRAANITEEGLDLSDVQEIDFPPREREIYSLHQGDLVVSEASGSPDQVGKPAVWKNDLPLCCFQNTVIRLRPAIVESEYVLVILQHCYFNRVFVEIAAGVGINHLGAHRLAQITVPLAPLDEQRAIAREVRQQLATLRSSRLSIDENLERAKQLRVSVLTQAFRGKLVESLPSPEPASVILERVRARRAEEVAATLPKRPLRKSKIMMHSTKHRPLLDVLKEHPTGVTPEELFERANFKVEEVDEFYAELARIVEMIIEEKPSGKAAFEWPATARVILRTKGTKTR